MLRKLALGIAAAIVLAGFGAHDASAQGRKLTLVTPGIPPIFASTIAAVADKQGFFKQFGVDVEVKSVETGTIGARALVAGDVDLSLSPTPLIVAQISNASVDIVGIYGLPSPSFLLAATDPNATCKDVAGQPVGVDAVGGARAVALRQMIAPCGVDFASVQQIALPSAATQQAMIAGRIKFGVLHFDEIPVVEAQGKPVKVVTTLNEANPNSHFALIAVRRAHLKDNRDAYVRVVAGLIAAARFIAEPKNADRVAEIIARPGRSADEVKVALKRFVEVNYWPVNDDGLPQGKLDAVVATAVRTGGILAGKQPVTYDRLVDRSIWTDAVALVGKGT